MPTRPPAARDWCTTTEAGRLLRMSAKTVRACCDEETLKSFKASPHSQHRRILLHDLLGFAVLNRVPSDKIRALLSKLRSA